MTVCIEGNKEKEKFADSKTDCYEQNDQKSLCCCIMDNEQF